MYSKILKAKVAPPDRGELSVTVNIHADNDPVKYGFDLLFPTIPSDKVRGFPVCEAVVETKRRGYASIYGWTQLVLDSNSTSWEFDYMGVTEQLDWPFCWFGPEPRLFDGPTRVGVSDIDWTARSFLTYIKDTVVSKNVLHVFGFEWGFTMRNGAINIKEVKELAASDWNEHIDYLTCQFPGWTFSKA